MPEPSPSDAARCLGLRCRSKRGERLNREERAFCVQMLGSYPDWYKRTERDVFYRTRPFGSGAKWSGNRDA
jgi:hypothetical protein